NKRFDDEGAVQWVNFAHKGKDSRVGYDYHLREPGSRWYWMAAEKPEGDYYVTEPYKAKEAQKWMVSVTRPVRDGSGRLIGVAGVDLYMQALQKHVQELFSRADPTSSGRGEYAFLVSPEKQVFALPDKVQEGLGMPTLHAVPLQSLPAQGPKVDSADEGKLVS